MMTSEGYTSDTSMSSPFSDSESGVGVNSNEAPKVPLEPVEGLPLMITYGQESSSNDEWHVVGEAKTRKNSPFITKVSSLLSPRRLARRRAAAKEAAASLQSTKPDEETVAVAKAKEHSDELQSRPGHIEGILSVKRTFICFEEEPTDECLCYHPAMMSREAPF
ncbi:hypothetical protein Pmar_PMAR013714 [Perkinsus marinus ATCC 50983]|uniref:Uncharacterized protein n=1 Tax=Perkinsus marinus (strain ATCC 50983 / TXsc) TaxID=423536 RepID=C5LY35_PERM5|nr:hypothetical protein Pmar_PMAR013714 [Perkinsus marinus ATCC 50983]EEQ98365.1 hypothetical protein Pmar_PMAR013714 [Perkinsus marinus ATCC 50983]|eukprot:XP_002765648.1 hypothetical protein Pmar_PMAR013714 [Perkinsus marinus ATCC 50983]